tara:strand:- start:53 stop:388 length:336 start_codon:yes stop_codon:yes gene_type:complete
MANYTSKYEPERAEAIVSLKPGAAFATLPDGSLQWDSPGITQPTTSEIDAELARLKTEWNNHKYQRDRLAKYSAIVEQLDQLWHDIDDGKLDKTGSWYLAVKAVKDANPKP